MDAGLKDAPLKKKRIDRIIMIIKEIPD